MPELRCLLWGTTHQYHLELAALHDTRCGIVSYGMVPSTDTALPFIRSLCAEGRGGSCQRMQVFLPFLRGHFM